MKARREVGVGEAKAEELGLGFVAIVGAEIGLEKRRWGWCFEGASRWNMAAWREEAERESGLM